MKTLAPLAAAFCVVAAQCPNNIAGTLITGGWGGNHIGLTATADSSQIEYDCAAGSIHGPIVLDAAGRFTATGSHTVGHGGPVRVDEVPEVHPARYEGRVRGNTMELRVVLTDQNQEIGTFNLERNAQPMVMRCL